jgi:hypothetical protein
MELDLLQEETEQEQEMKQSDQFKMMTLSQVLSSLSVLYLGVAFFHGKEPNLIQVQRPLEKSRTTNWKF